MDVTFEQILNFILIHNESIIQWLVIVVLALSLGVVGFSIFGRHPGTDDDRETGAASGRGERAGSPMGDGGNGLGGGMTATAAGFVTAEAAAAIAQVTHVQAELSQRTQELAQLKSDLEKAKGDNVDISEYLKKIKDLEGKLSEYEILEDDIADLSLYKDENTKLKAEIQRLSAGVPLGAAAMASPPVEAPTATPAAAVVAELSEPAPVNESEDDLVEQFASAMEQGKPPAPPAETMSMDPPGDDLLTEFAASIADSSTEAAEDLDTDKMLAEIAELDGEANPGTSGLEDDADIDKMAAEATKLVGTE